jgi:ribose/xylose/arabinose/galactoside ABC-type transport system permease subunit
MNMNLARRSRDFKIDLVLGNVLLLALVALVAYFASQTHGFLTFDNVQTILVNQAPLAVVVVALTLLVISGHIDLSIGSSAALSAMICALCVLEWGLPDGVALLLGVAVGMGVGAVNGLLCAYLGFNPIVVTLGMLAVVRGITQLIEENQVFGLGGVFTQIGAGDWVGIPAILWFVIGAFAAGGIWLTMTPGGRHVFAIGANPVAAYLSALPVRRLPFLLYVATGGAAGLAGILIAARLDGVTPGQHALTLELQALTVVLLGGVAFTGGRGRLFGVFVAWLFLATLENGLVIMNVTAYAQQVASGAALILAASLDALGIYLSTRLQSRARSTDEQRGGAQPPPRPGRPVMEGEPV